MTNQGSNSARGAARKRVSVCCAVEDVVARATAEATSFNVLSFSSQCLTDIPCADLADIEPRLSECSAVWIDVAGLADRDSIAMLLGLVEADSQMQDCVFAVQAQASCQLSRQNFLLTLHLVSVEESLELRQVTVLQRRNAVITIHDQPLAAIEEIKRDVRNQHSLLDSEGRLYIAQRVVEAVIDSYEPIMRGHSEELESIEEAIIYEPDSSDIQEVHSIRKELLFLKRTLLPLRAALRRLVRDFGYYGNDTEKIVVREMHDYVVDMLDTVEYYISVTADLLALHLSSVSNRMNQVMTVLAIVAAVFLPPSLVAGVYGMNFFEHSSPWNMPEVHWDLGYPFALALMVGISLIFLIYFWKNGWLKVLYASPTSRSGRRRPAADRWES